jgi:hypothetical protein
MSFRVHLLWTLLVLGTLSPSRSLALPWPSGGGKTTGGSGLQGSVASFKSVEKCVEELASQLPSEAISQVLGTDQVQLICTARQAAAKDDPEVCRRNLRDHNQRNQCLRFFAIYVGRPLDCPTRGWPTYHEGLCNALASRNPSLCLAAPKAILRGESQCASLGGVELTSCRREAQAWRGVLKPIAATLPSSFKASVEVRASSLTSSLTLDANSSQFKSPVLETGMLLADQAGSGDWFVIDRNFAPQEISIGVELQVPTPATGVGASSIGGTGGGQGKVSFRESGSYRHRSFQATSGTVTLSRFSRTAGGQLSGTFSVEFTDGVDKLKLDGQFDSFVSELVPLANVASYMRYRTGSSSSGSGYGTLAPDEVKKMQARILKVKDNTYDVDPSIRTDLIADTNKLTQGASVGKPYASPGSTGSSNFRIYSVYQNSLLWLLGFRDNDQIKKVNGKAMESREDFYDAYSRHKRTNAIVVVIERAGTEIKLSYRIKKVAAPKPSK